MRKLIFGCCILFVGLGCAQVPTGVKFISGQIGYSSTKDNSNDSKTASFKFIPTLGYFFAPNWAIAGSLGFKTETSKTQKLNNLTEWQSSKDVSSSFVAIPSLRKFWVLDEKLSLFGQLDIPLEFGKIKSETRTDAGGSYNLTQSEYNYFTYGISLKPGIDYSLNPRWKIVVAIGEIGYSSSKKENISGHDNNLNFGVNFSTLNFGLKYILPRKS